MADTPAQLVALQALDGIGAGVFGVASIALCADLTRGRGGFNTLAGLVATAVGFGGVVGPVTAGVIVQQWGFSAAYLSFAAVAALGALVFLVGMPDPAHGAGEPRSPGGSLPTSSEGVRRGRFGVGKGRAPDPEL